MESLQAEVAPFGSVDSGGTLAACGSCRAPPRDRSSSRSMPRASSTATAAAASIPATTTIEHSDAPTDPPSAATVYTSLWQTNHVGFLVERMLWWQRLATNAVQTLTVTP